MQNMQSIAKSLVFLGIVCNMIDLLSMCDIKIEFKSLFYLYRIS